jgi:hypothetical protein
MRSSTAPASIRAWSLTATSTTCPETSGAICTMSAFT